MPNRNLILKSLVGTPVTIFFQDMDGRFRWFVNPQSIWATDDRTGSTETELFGETDRARLQKARNDAAETETPRTVEATASEIDAHGHRQTWTLRLTVNKARDQQSGIDGFIYSCIDITDQKQREQTLKNLLREVSHRSKNILAMVLSLSAQTARSAPTKADYIRRFTGRLQSLAKSQDVVTDRDWRGSTLRELVGRQVDDVLSEHADQVELIGDDLELGPNGTLHVGLALHELVTNALVHGALSRPDGHVVIECSRSQFPDGGAAITWTETPRVPSAGQRDKSFGRTMLERIVPAAVNGKGVLDIGENAVVYILEIGPSEIV